MADETLTQEPEPVREHRENRKKNLGRKVLPTQARAVAKFIRVPPRKARLVMDEVRGKYAMEALAFLRFIPNRAAGYISKVLASAVANAANNHNLNPENLKLVEARVDEGPRLKRMQPRAQGRAYRILKRTSHLTVIVQEVAPKPRKPRAQATGRRAQAARAARQPQAAPAPAPAPQAAEPETAATPTVVEETTPVTAAAETPEVIEAITTTPETEAEKPNEGASEA
jgi:large subunit ribosomal protein L22